MKCKPNHVLVFLIVLAVFFLFYPIVQATPANYSSSKFFAAKSPQAVVSVCSSIDFSGVVVHASNFMLPDWPLFARLRPVLQPRLDGSLYGLLNHDRSPPLI